jgi:hypothetical protein
MFVPRGQSDNFDTESADCPSKRLRHFIHLDPIWLTHPVGRNGQPLDRRPPATNESLSQIRLASQLINGISRPAC